MGFERLIFVSGQGGTDPTTGKIADDVEQQTEQCLKNVQTILEAAGSGLQHVLRCGVFLMDMGEFKQMNAVYARMFGDHRPARTTVQVAGLPGEGLRVEIDAIAYMPLATTDLPERADEMSGLEVETPTAEASLWTTIRESLAGSHHGSYTEGSIDRAIVLLAIPMVLELVLESVFAVVDVFFVSRVGADAVATVGLTEAMMTLIYAVAMGLGTGATATVARRMGERDPEGAALAAVQAIALGLLVAVPRRRARFRVRPAGSCLDGRDTRRPGALVVHRHPLRLQRRHPDAVPDQRCVPRRRRRGGRDAGAVDRERDQHLSRSVPDLRTRPVSASRRHRRRGRDDDRAQHRRHGAAVLAVASDGRIVDRGGAISGWTGA